MGSFLLRTANYAKARYDLAKGVLATAIDVVRNRHSNGPKKPDASSWR